METVAFRAHHLKEIDLQDGQAYLTGWMSDEEAKAIEQEGWAYTALDNGIPVACAGIVNMWQGRALAWAYVSNRATGVKFLAVHKAVKRFLDSCYIQRIEMTVDTDFPQGYRWAEMLGFKMEAPCLKAYRPDGGDVALFARVL